MRAIGLTRYRLQLAKPQIHHLFSAIAAERFLQSGNRTPPKCESFPFSFSRTYLSRATCRLFCQTCHLRNSLWRSRKNINNSHFAQLEHAHMPIQKFLCSLRLLLSASHPKSAASPAKYNSPSYRPRFLRALIGPAMEHEANARQCINPRTDCLSVEMPHVCRGERRTNWASLRDRPKRRHRSSCCRAPNCGQPVARPRTRRWPGLSTHTEKALFGAPFLWAPISLCFGTILS
jgi:hypothetical protein